MTLQVTSRPTIYGPIIPAASMLNITSAIGATDSMAFNGAGDKVALMFQAPTSTVPDGIAFYCNFVTTAGSAGDVEATLETLDTSSLPSGTPVTNSATGTATVSVAGKYTITGMSGTASITAGDMYAIVLTAGSGWDRNLTIRTTIGANGYIAESYTAKKDSAGSWATSGSTNSGWNFAVLDSISNIMSIPGCAGAFSNFVNNSFTNATNPDERGNRFTVPFPCRCTGAYVLNLQGGAASTDGRTVTLYGDHTGTPTSLATVSFPNANRGGSVAPQFFAFPTPYDLVASTVYALAIKADSTGDCGVPTWEFGANADLAGCNGVDYYSTTANNGSAFTDDNTKVYCVFPLLSAFDDAVGGGSGGGMRLAGHGGLAA